MGDETQINRSLTVRKPAENVGSIPKENKAYELIPDTDAYDPKRKSRNAKISDLRVSNFKNLNFEHIFWKQAQEQIFTPLNLSKRGNKMINAPQMNWHLEIDCWNRDQFVLEICDYLDNFDPTKLDRHAVGLLAELIDTFVQCTLDIRKNGFVFIHPNGVVGKNHHVDIRDKAASRSLTLMSELGLTPRRRQPIPPPRNPAFEEWLKGPNWKSEDS